MKFKLTYFLIFAFLVSCKQKEFDVTSDFKSKQISEYITSSELDSINENWVNADSIFLSKLKKIIKNDERNIIDIFKIDKNDKRTELGFGYEQIEGSIGSGYVSIFYNLVFKEAEVISYELSPQLPRNKSLIKRYKKFYSGIFKIENNIIHNRYYNIEEMEKPLNDINPNISLNENLKFLMTPFSGTLYGFSGGFGGELFVNRKIFLEEIKNITPEVCEILMNSKNPGTRLMAIEYYLKSAGIFYCKAV